MLFSVKNLLTGALALAGVAAPAAAMAPLCEYFLSSAVIISRERISWANTIHLHAANDVHTETAGAQEIGSTTSDGTNFTVPSSITEPILSPNLHPVLWDPVPETNLTLVALGLFESLNFTVV
jgi:hypothetical protein